MLQLMLHIVEMASGVLYVVKQLETRIFPFCEDLSAQ